LRRQRGFEGLQVLTDPSTGEGIIVTVWETEADAETSEATSSYIGQMSMMSS
jgi:heme-degrading monooxygenase HmoA